MLNRLQAASRLLIRASLVLFTGVVLLLIQSTFWSSRVSASMQAIVLATALLSYFRPQYGLLALAALVPLGQVGSRTLDSQMRGAEALVLAFLAGALVRGWTLREFRAFPSTRLEIAALIFGLVVAASCLEQIWFMQIQMDFVWPFMQSMLSHASGNYLTSPRFGMLSRAMLLLEGMALLMYVVRYVTTSADFTRRLVVMLVVGAIATAILTLVGVAGDFAQTRESGASLVDFFARGRWSGHIADLNAAGSYFAMTAFLTLGMGFKDRQWRSAWLGSSAVLFLAMLMSGSRTAVAAAGLVGVLIVVRVAMSHPSHAVRAFGAGGVLLAAGMAVLLMSRPTSATPSVALSIRWWFLETTAGMLRAEPAFGIGIGQYSLWSAHFAPPELLSMHQPDNAHNNFAQVAGELGLVGLMAFLVMIAGSMWPSRNQVEGRLLRGPILIGLSVFIVTWLGGHPLLVAEVAYPFWITLGVAAALAASDSKANPSVGIICIAAALLLISIPFRVGAKSAELDFSRVSYGVSAKRLMTTRARFFVPASESRVEFPLRARNARDTEPVEIDVAVDGSASGTITLSDRNWRRTPIDLSGDSSRRFHQIDLQIRPDTLDNVDPGRSSVEVGKWEIIAKPNG
jgi:hypothetical protein